MSEIRKLREKFVAGEWDVEADDTAISLSLQWQSKTNTPKTKVYDLIYTAFSGSLDAAMTLHGLLLPGWLWASQPKVSALLFPDMPDFDGWIYRVWKPGKGGDTARSDDPARAWLIAILKALEVDE